MKWTRKVSPYGQTYIRNEMGRVIAECLTVDEEVCLLIEYAPDIRASLKDLVDHVLAHGAHLDCPDLQHAVELLAMSKPIK